MGMIKMKIVALYDEGCLLCQEVKGKLQKLDSFHKVNWKSLQEYEKTNLNTRFTAEELRKELHIILPNEQVLKGYDAVRKILLLSPYTFLVGILLYIPFIPIIGRPLYRWIATNRHLFMKRKCDDDSCSIR